MTNITSCPGRGVCIRRYPRTNIIDLTSLPTNCQPILDQLSYPRIYSRSSDGIIRRNSHCLKGKCRMNHLNLCIPSSRLRIACKRVVRLVRHRSLVLDGPRCTVNRSNIFLFFPSVIKLYPCYRVYLYLQRNGEVVWICGRVSIYYDNNRINLPYVS
jgi:hypothetical protein